MHSYQRENSKQKGSITVFFLLFVLIAAGAISYSVYIGRLTTEKIKTHNAADAAAFAMAAHGAQGMNMMAVNNLAIGASLHIAAAAPTIGRYYAIGKAFSLSAVNKNSWKEYGTLLTSGDDSDFASGFKFMAHLSGHFVKTASTLTTLNKQIASYWMIAAIPKGLEQMRINRPGAIGMPMQVSRPIGTVGIPDFFHYRYDMVRQTEASTAMCHTISASKGNSGGFLGMIAEQRNLASAWLRGPVESFGSNSALAAALDIVELMERSIQSLGKIINTPVKALIGAIEAMESAACDWNFGLNPVCGPIGRLKDVLQALLLPVPEFESCGLNDHGNFAEQIDHFLNSGSDFNQIGFLYPHVTSQAEREQFEKGLSFAMVVGMPMMRREELPRDAEGAVKCPAAWTYEIDGVKQCDLLLDGIDMGAGEGKGTGWDSASGGTAGAMRTTAHGDAGKLANAWKRVQWSLAQARIAYRPDGASGDPTINDIGGYGPNDPAALNKIRMQMFWPAWQAELTHVTVWQDVLGHLGQ